MSNFHHCDQFSKKINIIQGRVNFGTVSEDLVHGHWLYCFCACGRAEYHGGEPMIKQSISLHGDCMWEEGREVEDAAPVLNFLP